jgi:phage anti-repressor protein
MKITDFLKRHSLIDNQFIDDFYSFYDDGQNEYDYTINLEKLAFWLEVQKGHLKTLLDSNFIENEDYILYKNKDGKGMGSGYNKRIHIMLRYTCAKELCMLSRSEKSSVIRKFYIDLEKLIITYKDSIVKDLNSQLGKCH